MSAIRCLIRAVLLGALVCAVGGCAAVGWFVAQFAPPEKIDALYTIPPGKVMLVLVDDPTGTLQYMPIKRDLAERIGERLTANEIARRTVPYRKLLDVMAATPAFDQLSIGQIGKMCGAEVVLHVQIDELQFRDERDSPLWHGRLRTTIKVIDTEAGRLWPTDRPGGYRIEPVETPITAESDPGHKLKLANRLSEQMADRIAKCFYEHRGPRDPQFSWQQ